MLAPDLPLPRVSYDVDADFYRIQTMLEISQAVPLTRSVMRISCKLATEMKALPKATSPDPDSSASSQGPREAPFARAEFSVGLDAVAHLEDRKINGSNDGL